jgi:hypothetical protein
MVLMGSYWTRPERLTVSSRVAMLAISLGSKTLWRLYSCDALLEWLAQDLQHLAALWQFIQEEHPLVREGNLTRHRHVAPTDQPCV